MPCALLLKKIKLHFIYCMWVHVPWATWESWFSFFYHVGPRNQTRILRLHLINEAKMIQGLAHTRQVFHSSGPPAPHWQSLWRHSTMNYTLTISQTHRDRWKRSRCDWDHMNSELKAGEPKLWPGWLSSPCSAQSTRTQLRPAVLDSNIQSNQWGMGCSSVVKHLLGKAYSIASISKMHTWKHRMKE